MVPLSRHAIAAVSVVILGCSSEPAPAAPAQPPGAPEAAAPTASAPAASAAPAAAEPKGYGYEFAEDDPKKKAAPAPPAAPTSGRLPPEVIQKTVRAKFDTFRKCYEAGLKKDKKLAGSVKVRFVIKEDGSTDGAKDDGSTLKDPAVIECIVKEFGALKYQKPEGGIVTVVYPIAFSP